MKKFKFNLFLRFLLGLEKIKYHFSPEYRRAKSRFVGVKKDAGKYLAGVPFRDSYLRKTSYSKFLDRKLREDLPAGWVLSSHQYTIEESLRLYKILDKQNSDKTKLIHETFDSKKYSKYEEMFLFINSKKGKI